ncbi:SpoIIE family protein phosphatase [Streptomyces sp. WMMC500]|uniref:ATP-binding SpoIIE family protein phosphatase n=1 Tax=Streptomyces sp. WMMC500 TaxID=3015154 RepID=UPI00248BE448|nr:SpoIIE family protein phosphatase [Streptomyces sp. WMMC500]WBB64145.1 SpoIIE family protein phosphatase [Streptomyces sp. WMMC500]
MRTEEVLSGLGTGVWRWAAHTDRVVLDAQAARLLGLPPVRVNVHGSAVRARVHGVDFIELNGILDLALAEGTLAEGRLRVVDTGGDVVRVVRWRMRAQESAAEQIDVVGTIEDLSEEPSGRGEGPRGTSDWRLSREAFLLSAGRSLAEARSTDQVLRVAASLSMPGFSPDGMAVFAVEGDDLVLIGQQGHRAENAEPFRTTPMDFPFPAPEAARTGRAVYIAGREEYARRYPEAWRRAEGVPHRSWAFLPLMAEGRTVGAWMAAFEEVVSFTPDERSVLTTVARMLGQALSDVHVHESERELAEGLQRSMKPAVALVPGFDVAARYVPSGGGLQIGGDWYDVFALPSGQTALVIGDVQGHDVRAAGLMSQLRIAIRAYASEGHRPDAVLTRASAFLTRLNERQFEDPADARFATCLYLQANPAAGTLTVARAGHLDPAVALPDGTMIIHPSDGGLPLGIEDDPVYPVSEHKIDPDETMLLCTDGLVETGGHDLYSGQARLGAAFAATLGAGLETVADAIVDAVAGPGAYVTRGPHSGRSQDDIAFVLLRTAGATRLAHPESERHMYLAVPQTEQQRISDARHQLRGMLYDWATADQIDAAELALSEMIANVMMHTDSTANVMADVTGPPGRRLLRMTIADADGNLPHRRHPGEMASSGRGVLLLQELCDGWGVEPRGDGKAIWAEFREDDVR